MLDIGWSEMLMIAVVAIVVIGPKDLPRTLRTIGQWIGKARAVTRDLQNSVNDMIADSEIEELRKAGSSMADDYPTLPPAPKEWPPDEGKGDGAGDAGAGDTSSVKSTGA